MRVEYPSTMNFYTYHHLLFLLNFFFDLYEYESYIIFGNSCVWKYMNLFNVGCVYSKYYKSYLFIFFCYTYCFFKVFSLLNLGIKLS